MPQSQGGMPNGIDGVVWDIHGTSGDIRLTAPFGHSQMAELSLFGGKNGDGDLSAIKVPEKFFDEAPADRIPGNVTRHYARMAADIRTGSQTATTFDDAVGVQRLIDAIEQSSVSGTRVTLPASNRPIPLPV